MQDDIFEEEKKKTSDIFSDAEDRVDNRQEDIFEEEKPGAAKKRRGEKKSGWRSGQTFRRSACCCF